MPALSPVSRQTLNSTNPIHANLAQSCTRAAEVATHATQRATFAPCASCFVLQQGSGIKRSEQKQRRRQGTAPSPLQTIDENGDLLSGLPAAGTDSFGAGFGPGGLAFLDGTDGAAAGAGRSAAVPVAGGAGLRAKLFPDSDDDDDSAAGPCKRTRRNVRHMAVHGHVHVMILVFGAWYWKARYTCFKCNSSCNIPECI